jgi:hypothetical protein
MGIKLNVVCGFLVLDSQHHDHRPPDLSFEFDPAALMIPSDYTRSR